MREPIDPSTSPPYQNVSPYNVEVREVRCYNGTAPDMTIREILPNLQRRHPALPKGRHRRPRYQHWLKT